MANGNGQALFIGFLTLVPTEQEGIIGAALITDERGVPHEFRVTEPVKPSPMQRVIYGEPLEAHVGVDIVGKPILSKLEAKPEILLVDKPFLVAVRDTANYPVIYLRRAGETLTVGGASSGITVESKRTQPATLESDPGFEDDVQQAGEIFRHLADRIDLFEPFERIATAIGVLTKQDERFR